MLTTSTSSILSQSSLQAGTIAPAMETVLRQSKTMCPFLKKTSPATLRSLSATSGPTRSYHASPGGGSMSNLQTIADRCPVMHKAMAVQSGAAAFKAIPALKGVRCFSGKAHKAKLHTSSEQKARPIDGLVMGEKRMSQTDRKSVV